MRGQTSVEFLLLVAFGTLIFVVFFGVIQDRIIDVNNQELNDEMGELKELITSEFELALRFGSGYEREFWLPPTVLGITYETNITNNDTLTISAGSGVILYFFDYPVYGQFNTGKNTILSFHDAIYLNYDISDILTITIDGDDADWKALSDWYGIAPISDKQGDYYYLTDPKFDWDIKSGMIWNDNESMYFFLELYDNNIQDYELDALSEKVDYLILLDTDKDSSTGYQSSDYNLVMTAQGNEILITDTFSRIEGEALLGPSPHNPCNSLSSPQEFQPGPQGNWDWYRASGTKMHCFAYIGSNAIEISVTLDSLSIDPTTSPVIGYTFLTRENSTGKADYLPGAWDDFEGGFYVVQNR